MGDGKAVQMGTSHELGHTFASAFGIDYLDSAGERQLCWTTSWGASTRLIGALIMGHGDDRGLVVPPRLAPIQVVVLQISDEPGAADAARRLTDDLGRAGLRAEIDAGADRSFGRRSVDWELKGVPLRLEMGARDLAAGDVTVVRRDRSDKTTHPLDGVVDHVRTVLEDVQRDLLQQTGPDATSGSWTWRPSPM